MIGLGSNLGESRALLEQALGRIATLGEVSAVSSLYESDPIGPPQPVFLNAACRLQTALEPAALLAALLGIERDLGRVRRERWGPRLVDLDVLWIRGIAVETPELRVPHPELQRRAFALRPLLDVAPDASDPRDGSPYAGALLALGPTGVRRISESVAPWAFRSRESGS